MHALVTGANRGIGLALTAALLARGDRVVATARDPAAPALHALEGAAGGRLEILPFDVGRDESADALARALAGRPLDLAIANAGIYGARRASGGAIDLAEVAEVFGVNTLGALRTANAVRPSLRAAAARRGGEPPKLVAITSGMASIAEQGGGALPYRVSKAALNMAIAVLAKDWAGDGIATAVINPGWVRTDMGGAGASITADASAAGILREIGRLTLADSGAFLSHDGRRIPW